MKKSVIVFSCIVFLFTLCLCIFPVSIGMEDYENVEFSLGLVSANYLNLRAGPGTNFKSIDVLKKNEQLRIYSKIGDWYIVQNGKNLVGCAHSKYIISCEDEEITSSDIQKIEDEYSNLTSAEIELLTLINNERAKQNLTSLKIDDELQNVARIKAQDLVDYNYFSHTSPVYGSPFEMLKNNGINYKTASENIAGNKSIQNAVSSWMNSESHKSNILSNDYNYTGVAVVDSISYGKILVEFFIGR